MTIREVIELLTIIFENISLYFGDFFEALFNGNAEEDEEAGTDTQA